MTKYMPKIVIDHQVVWVWHKQGGVSVRGALYYRLPDYKSLAKLDPYLITTLELQDSGILGNLPYSLEMQICL